MLIGMLWLAIIAAAASLLAARRPAVAARATSALVCGLLVGWLLLGGLGIAALRRPHLLLGYGVVILAWVAFWFVIPAAIQRTLQTGRILRLLVHVGCASASLALVLFSALTGYLGDPPVTEASYLRFRLLHTLTVPLLGTVALLGWCAIAMKHRFAGVENSS